MFWQWLAAGSHHHHFHCGIGERSTFYVNFLYMQITHSFIRMKLILTKLNMICYNYNFRLSEEVNGGLQRQSSKFERCSQHPISHQAHPLTIGQTSKSCFTLNLIWPPLFFTKQRKNWSTVGRALAEHVSHYKWITLKQLPMSVTSSFVNDDAVDGPTKRYSVSHFTH